jgi:hypothetical protein
VTQEVDQLARRIRQDIDEIQRIRDLSLRRWEKALLDHDYLGSVAFDLNSFYHGVERILQAFAKAIDGNLPTGDAWHKQLLDQMTKEAPGVRPAILSEATKAALDQYRTFRHVARNIYTVNLDIRKMAGLVDGLPETVEKFCSDIMLFLDFLKQRG